MKILIRLDDEALAPAAGPAAGRDVASAAAQALATARAAKAQSARAEAGIDRVLVQRFNAGDEAAFVEIVTRYRGMITALALRFLRNHADAEEIAQDTFIRAHRGLAQFRGESSLATWLHRIAVNLSRNRYWHFFRRRRHMTISLDVPLGPESSATFTELVAGGEAGPARQATVDEFVAVVAVCMEKLDDPSREILTLRTLMHDSYEEIARALGINQGTVKSRIARARGKLRELMVEECPEFPVGAAPAAWFEAAHGLRLVS